MAADKQRRAFISYSRTNKEFATKLAKGLRSAGYPVWFDLMDIPTGSRWDDEVEKALRECSVFMIILTPASIASENVKDEIGYVIDHGKRILPVLLENCEVPLRLRRFQYVDFTTKSFEEGFESAKELLGDLIDEVSVPVPARTSTVENQMTVKAKYERYAPVKPATEGKDMRESGVGRKKPVSKGLVTGTVGAVAVLILCIIAGIGFNALYKMVNSNTPVVNPATETPVVASTDVDISGVWAGKLDQNQGERVFDMRLNIDQAFAGEVSIDSFDTTEKCTIIDNYWDGYKFHFTESEGKHFWGTLENGHLIGFVAWDCYDCAYWGTFELSK